MGRIQWPMSYLELTIARLELSSNLLVAHAFAWQVMIYFVSHVIMFWQWQTGKYKQCPANIYSFTSNTRKSILFPETCTIARARADTHASLHVQFIARAKSQNFLVRRNLLIL